MLNSEALIKKIKSSSGFFDANAELMISWFCDQHLDFTNLLHNKLLIQEKFHILKASSRVNAVEKIADEILNNLNKKIAIFANSELALVVDNALRARNIKFNNQVNRVYSDDELYFIKVAHYLSKKSAHEIGSIYFFEKDQKIIGNYHALFQNAYGIQELIKINKDLYIYLTGKIFDTSKIKLYNFSYKKQYFELVVESLGDLKYRAEENIIITSVDSAVYNFDYCVFVPFSYEEYCQSFKLKFPLIEKQDLENRILEIIMINFFSNRGIYISYDSNVKRKPYLFEIIYELLVDIDVAQEQEKEVIIQHYQPPCHYLQKKDLPQEIYVTAVEKLMRNPYLYYTNHILKLKPLQSMEEELEKLFGIVLHEVLATAIHKILLSVDDFINEFRAIVDDILMKRNLNSVVVRLLWLPKFLKIAEWIWHYEQDILLNRERVLTEVEGWMIVDLKDIKIKLCAKIDRIDLMKDGSVNVIDYKSGILPSDKDVKIGIVPQMPLEALIIKNGYINNELIEVTDEKINLYYLNLTGRNNIGESKLITIQLENILDQLTKLLKKFWLDDPCFFFENKNSYLNRQYKHFVRYVE